MNSVTVYMQPWILETILLRKGMLAIIPQLSLALLKEKSATGIFSFHLDNFLVTIFEHNV